MSKFKVGDKVSVKCDDGDWSMDFLSCVKTNNNIFTISVVRTDDRYVCKEFSNNLWNVHESKLELITNNNNMNLIQKFKLTLKSEPEKTLIKTGIMNDNETLTSEGKDLFFEWEFQKNKEKFTEEVAKKILEEQEQEESK